MLAFYPAVSGFKLLNLAAIRDSAGEEKSLTDARDACGVAVLKTPTFLFEFTKTADN